MKLKVVHAEDDGKKISIQFEYEDGSFMNQKCNMLNTWMHARMVHQSTKSVKSNMKNLKKKFGLLVGEIEQMIGKTIMIEVKKAMGKYVYMK